MWTKAHLKASWIFISFITMVDCVFSQTIDTTFIERKKKSYSVLGAQDSWYSWNVEGGEISEDTKTSSIHINWGKQEGLHRITVVEHSKGGCYGDTITAWVLLKKRDRPLIITPPNVFTPNNDGVNDHFKIEFEEMPDEFSLTILSRWGNIIFSSNKTEQAWDGKWNGSDVPSGVYYWFVNYRFADKIDSDKGFVELLR